MNSEALSKKCHLRLDREPGIEKLSDMTFVCHDFRRRKTVTDSKDRCGASKLAQKARSSFLGSLFALGDLEFAPHKKQASKVSKTQ